jgi:AcrR family transcriptional regulator
VGSARTRRVHDTRRQEILQRLQDLVLARGFAHLRIDELTHELHCSRSTLYAISSSKEHLVITVIKYFFRDAVARVEEKIAVVADPSERIASYLAAVGTEMRRMSPACYADMVASDFTREVYAVNSSAAAHRVHQLVREGIRDGSFREVHAEFVAEVVGLLIDAILHGELLARTGLSSGEAYAELGNMVLAALANKNGWQQRNGLNIEALGP